MKISNSKQELARIISENGGWRDGEFAAQDKASARIDFYHEKPWINGGQSNWNGEYIIKHKMYAAEVIPNWHQTILSREEYFFLHQNQGLEDALDEPMIEAKPTIEQLAADYRNAKDYADRKQQEADAAKADADEKLRVLELAGEALGLLVSPITAKQEPELVINDWRDLQVGDIVLCIIPNGGLVESGSEGVVTRIMDSTFYSDFPEQRDYTYAKYHLEDGAVKFIRRP